MQPYSSAAFYIIAHQDDWQLFMSPNAYRDLRRSDMKVVFIYTTGGDAGKDTSYWQAREKAALQSVRFACDTPDSLPQDVIEGERRACEHRLHYCEYKNTASYFLRLPDGRLSGKGSEIYRSESLTKLRSGAIGSMTTLDNSTTYRDWQDVTRTLADIISAEAEGCSHVWLNTSDYWLIHEAISNPDHIATGLAVAAASAVLGDQYSLTLFRDYETGLLPINISARQALWKGSLFAAYDVTMQRELNHCTFCESKYYGEWPLRQYCRQIHTNPIKSAAGNLWIYLLQLMIGLRILSMRLRGKLPEKSAANGANPD